MAKHQTRMTTILLRVAVAVVLLAAAAYVFLHLEWQKETVRSGMTGEARRNPYHAGMLLLSQSGYFSKRLDDAIALDGLSPTSTLLLDSPALFNNRKQAAKLVGWVQRGGHLVLPLHRRTDPEVLLRLLGVHTLGWNETAKNLQVILVEDEPGYPDLRNAVVFDVHAKTEWESKLRGYFEQPDDATDEEASSEKDAARQPPRAFNSGVSAKDAPDTQEERSVYARWKLGRGYVTIGHFEPFRNVAIDHSDHASLFVRLMTLPKDKRPIYIALTAEYPSLGTWLVQHAGEALIALALLLAALLWRAMPRFGPPTPIDAPARPGLLEHLSAVGDFLLREKQYEALIAPLREEVVARLTQLRSHHPEIQTLPELGAHITRLDLQDVNLALTPNPNDAHEFQRRSRTLATLRKHCGEMQNAFS